MCRLKAFHWIENPSHHRTGGIWWSPGITQGPAPGALGKTSLSGLPFSSTTSSTSHAECKTQVHSFVAPVAAEMHGYDHAQYGQLGCSCWHPQTRLSKIADQFFVFFAFTLWRLDGPGSTTCGICSAGPSAGCSSSWVLGADCRVDDQLRVPRGNQRAIGAMMLTTPSGSDRHYTMDFAQFCERYGKDPFFAEWLKPSHDDIVNLATGATWKGQGPFPMG